MQFSIEVLPAPFGPMMARISPFWMSNETSVSAFTPPKPSDTFSTARITSPLTMSGPSGALTMRHPRRAPLPLVGRGWGWGSRGARGQDRGENAVQRGHDLAVGEAEDAQTLGRQNSCPLLVATGVSVEPVLVPVHLDDESTLQAAEIDDVRPERDLPA
jgi:hypothetical protein